MTLRVVLPLLCLLALYGFASTTEPRPQAGDVRQGREGTVSHVGAGFPADYLALPLGPGVRVKLCGPARCLTLTSTDAGPNAAMLRAGRIADVSVPLFVSLCGCDESRGLFEGSWSRVDGPKPTPPQTDTEAVQ